MSTDKLGYTKEPSTWLEGFGLVTIAAVTGVLNPDPSPFITVVTWIAIICGTTLCICAQREGLEERARRGHDE